MLVVKCLQVEASVRVTEEWLLKREEMGIQTVHIQQDEGTKKSPQINYDPSRFGELKI